MRETSIERPTGAAPLVALERVSLARSGRRILEDVSLAIGPGEIVTVVGPNGGGKTSLLRVVVSELQPDRGQVRRAADLRIGFMPQRLAIDRAFPLTLRRFLTLAAPRAAADIDAALDRAGARPLAEAQLADLSGGEFQRALLARALVRRPNLFVLDEPTQALDQAGAAAFYRLIDELRRESGAGVLLVSHDLHVVMAASTRVVCLNRHICCAGAPADVSAHPEYLRLFGARDAAALAIYRHSHDHTHHHDHAHRPDHTHHPDHPQRR